MKTTAQKRKESREARAADPYAYQRSQERKRMKKPAKRPENVAFENTAAGAIVRLSLHVSTYPEYLDRDRDMILLYIVKMVEGLKTRP
jgi:hypothetical protein